MSEGDRPDLASKLVAVEVKVEILAGAVEKLDATLSRQVERLETSVKNQFERYADQAVRQYDKLTEQVSQAALRDRQELAQQIDKTTQGFVSMLKEAIADQNAKHLLQQAQYKELLPFKYKVIAATGVLATVLYFLSGAGGKILKKLME